MQSVTIGNNQAGQRLDKFLRKYLPSAGSSFLYKMLRKKNITLNGKRAEGKEMLSVGDTVCFFFSEETFAKFSGSNAPQEHRDTPNASKLQAITAYQEAYRSLTGIEVLYEDANIVILNKPMGILTQKAKPSDVSLNEWLIGYLLQEGCIDEAELKTFHPSVCNRLDRNTSGIVLCGKTLAGSQALSRVIKERLIQKFYHTICLGELQEKQLLKGYLKKDAATNKVTISASPSKEDAAEIWTAYEPLGTAHGYTLLEVELITGKTHQIRAHLAGIRHPIIGDYKYGNLKQNNILKDKYQLEAQLLHACRMVFPTDETGVLASLNGRSIEAPYPQLFQRIKNDMGFHNEH